MFLFEFIIKILVGNSDTVFIALIMAVFGYYGWLLWNVNEHLNYFLEEWEKHGKNLEELKSKIDDLDESVYRELIIKIDENIKKYENLLQNVKNNSDELEKVKADIIGEIKESVDEMKGIIMILVNNRLRSFNSEDDKKSKDSC